MGRITALCGAIAMLAAMAPAPAPAVEREIITIPGLDSPVRVYRDVDGIPHIRGRSETDVTLAQGWQHARDRLFQMDVSRKLASGRSAELLGPAALDNDVQLRTIGLRRAAERSLAALSPELVASLEAYAEGVNTYVAQNGLPVEYALLERTEFEPWTALDSVATAKLIAFQLSFGLDITPTINFLTYQGTGQALGFDGTALYLEDMFRSQPLALIATVPQATGSVPYIPLGGAAAQAPAAFGLEAAGAKALAASPAAATKAKPVAAGNAGGNRDALLALARGYYAKASRADALEAALHPTDKDIGSNEFGVTPALSEDGQPIVANDPHLALNTPSTFYQLHLSATSAGLDIAGSSFPGVPWLVQGQNRHIAWGSTVHSADVTDVYQEALVADGGSPSGLATLYQGVPEPIIPIPETFFYNIVGDSELDNLELATPNSVVGGTFIPAATLIVPRRNQGPILDLDLGSMTAISLQYTGFSPTRELDAFRLFNLAESVADFRAGLDFFDVGSQNFIVMDTDGNLGYFAWGEFPIREDLQANTVNGSPPWFIRNGTGGNEWLAVTNPQPNQAVGYEILPGDELPQVLNPDDGFIINANNDSAGTTLDNDPLNQLRVGGQGLYYLTYEYSIGNRAARITDRFQEAMAAGDFTPDIMVSIQADDGIYDAEVLTPFILEAWENAQDPGAPAELQALGADPEIAEAVARLGDWDQTTPTGIFEGYDDTDVDGERLEPTDEEIAHSVAATIFGVWRGQIIANTVDATLNGIGLPRPGSSDAVKAVGYLFESFDTNEGVGESGVNFFNVPGIAGAEDRRDIIVLASLRASLDLLAGPEFEAVFSGSTDQSTYRWGRLHCITFDALLGGPFNIPPAGGAFPPSFDDRPGLCTDGGFDTVDASRHNSRADSAFDFGFGSGPVRRYVGQPDGSGITGRTSLPGGSSGDVTSPFYTNLMGRWLTNDTYTIRQDFRTINRESVEVLSLQPPRQRGRRR